MRLELHVFLWVTAGLAVLLQLSGGLRLPVQISSDRAQMRAQLVDTNGQPADPEIDTHNLVRRIDATEYDRAARPMFNVIAAQDALPATVNLPEPILPPVLKGLLGGAEGRRAVFSRGIGTTDVVIVSAGTKILGYHIDLIGDDFVLATAPEGDQVRLQLRGAGEGN